MTRDEILEAAAQIISQKGFHAASMQDIAHAVNLQKGSLYHHVSSKQEILVALLDQALDMLIDRMQTVMARSLPPDEKLRLAIEDYLSGMLEHKDLSVVMLMEHRSLDAFHAAQHIPRRDRYEHLWRELVREGMEAGIFCTQDVDMMVRALLGILNWTVTWYRPDGSLSPQQIASQFSTLFLNGLICR